VESSPGILLAICISGGGIPRTPILQANLTQQGIEGDGHRYESHFQKARGVTIFAAEGFAKLGEGKFEPGCVGENITTSGIDFQTLTVGTILQLGDVEIRLTKLWKPCHAYCGEKAQPVPNRAGVTGFFAEATTCGILQPGCAISIVNRSISHDV